MTSLQKSLLWASGLTGTPADPVLLPATCPTMLEWLVSIEALSPEDADDVARDCGFMCSYNDLVLPDELREYISGEVASPVDDADLFVPRAWFGSPATNARVDYT